MAVRHLNCSYMYSCSDVSKKIIVLLETLYQTIYSSLQQILRCQSSGHRLFQTRFGHGQQKSPLLNGACPLPGSSEQMWMFVPLAYSTIQQTSLNDVMLGKAELWYAKALVLDGRTYEERILKILVILGNLRGGHLNQSRNHTVFLEWALTHLCLLALMRHFSIDYSLPKVSPGSSQFPSGLLLLFWEIRIISGPSPPR